MVDLVHCQNKPIETGFIVIISWTGSYNFHNYTSDGVNGRKLPALLPGKHFCVYLSQVTPLTLNVKGLHHIMIDELEVFMADPVLHVPLPPREEVIHHGHLVAIHHQLVRQVGTNETSPTSNLAQAKQSHQKTQVLDMSNASK